MTAEDESQRKYRRPCVLGTNTACSTSKRTPAERNVSCAPLHHLYPAMPRHRQSLSLSELQASLQYAQTYLTTDGAAEAFARRRGLRISVAEEAKERRKRIEQEMALLSQHLQSRRSAQIEQQLARLKAEWRKARVDEKSASQALKSPSLVGECWTLARRELSGLTLRELQDRQRRASALCPPLCPSQDLSALFATRCSSLGAPHPRHPPHLPTPTPLLPTTHYLPIPPHHATPSH
jgi:hypothetical protein